MPASPKQARDLRDLERRLARARVAMRRMDPDIPQKQRDKILDEYLDARRAFEDAGMSVAQANGKKW